MKFDSNARLRRRASVDLTALSEDGNAADDSCVHTASHPV